MLQQQKQVGGEDTSECMHACMCCSSTIRSALFACVATLTRASCILTPSLRHFCVCLCVCLCVRQVVMPQHGSKWWPVT